MREIFWVILANLFNTSAFASEHWTMIRPGGDALCARGTPYAFFVSAGDSDKILIDFMGGGACWDAQTCAPGSNLFQDQVNERFPENPEREGIYRKDHPNNPFRGWTHILIPYCTGDVHWGSRDTEYQKPDGTSFVIHHRGAQNVQSVMNWLKNAKPYAREVVVQGCSAGSYGSIFWTPQLAQQYPFAKIRQFGDSGAGVMTPEFLPKSLLLWNFSALAPYWVFSKYPGSIDYSVLKLTDFYEKVAAFYPEIEVAQFNHHEDFIQRLFYTRMGGNHQDWTLQMLNSQTGIRARTPNFSYFIAPTDEHCITNIDQFYTTASDGVPISYWLSEYIRGRKPQDVGCRECRP